MQQCKCVCIYMFSEVNVSHKLFNAKGKDTKVSVCHGACRANTGSGLGLIHLNGFLIRPAKLVDKNDYSNVYSFN